MAEIAQSPRARGVAGRIAAAWTGPRAAAAEELGSDAGEGRLLAYALGGCAALFLAALPGVLHEARAIATPQEPVAAVVTANLVSFLFFTPLMLYAVAAAMRAILRLFGGTGGWRETRHAAFWSLLVASPALVAGGAIDEILRVGGLAAFGEVGQATAGVVWLWFWSCALGQAHGFRSALPIFAATAGLGVALSLSA